jgi:hypothetical protein
MDRVMAQQAFVVLPAICSFLSREGQALFPNELAVAALVRSSNRR